MSVTRRALSVPLSLACGLAICACASRAPLPAPQAPFTLTPADAFRERPPDAWPSSAELETLRVQHVRLPNGMDLFCVENPEIPIVSLRYVNRGATTATRAAPPGLASVTAQSLLDATVSDDGEVLYGLRIGGIKPWAESSLAGTQIGLQILSPGWKPALRTLAQMVQQPAFPEPSVTRFISREFERVYDGSRSLEGLSLPLSALTLLGESDPWAMTAQERLQQLRTLRPLDVADYHRDLYRPSNSALIVVGDVSMSEVERLAREHFGRWTPDGSVSGRARRALLPVQAAGRKLATADRRRVLALYSSGEQSYLILPQRAVGTDHADRVPLELLVDVIAGGFQSRAELALRHTGGITYGVQASLIGNADRAILQIATAVQDSGVGEAVERLQRELERLRREPVADDELERARSRYRGRFYAVTTEGIAGVLARRYLERLDETELETLERRALDVGPEDLLRVARTYLDPAGDLVIVGNFLATRAQLEELGKVQYFQLR